MKLRTQTDDITTSAADASRPVAFLDRDGIINVRAAAHRYVRHPEEFRLVPGAVEMLRGLRDLGYELVVITNQQGVGKGLMTEADLTSLHAWMSARLASEGVTLTAIFACTHLASDDCPCRKPKPGMIHRAQDELPFRVDLSRSVVIGDAVSDMQAGQAGGVKTLVLVSGSADVAPTYATHRVVTVREALALLRLRTIARIGAVQP